MDTQLKVMTRSVMAAMLCIAGSSHAQTTVSDDFTQYANQTSWTTYGGACLTATGSTLPVGLTAASTGIIATCNATTSNMGGYGGSSYPSGYMANNHNDPGGYGALRLTSAATNQAGAIVWNSTFPSNAGIAITFTAVSYDGNSYGGADGGTNGADGLSFFLLDASVTPVAIGQFGGSLGYSCSQSKGPGATGAYIGLGIDEYGNYLNSGDNTVTGVANTNNVGAVQFQGNRVGLRGAGAINWQQLNTNSTYGSYYPSSLSSSNKTAAIENTCSTGSVWDYTQSTPVQVSPKSYSALVSFYPSYYPATLSSTLQTSALNQAKSTGMVWNYNSSTAVHACLSWTQLHDKWPNYYPYTLTSTQQSTAVAATCSTGTVWDYSGNNSSPDYASGGSGGVYNLGQCYTYAQLNTLKSSYYPSSLSSSLQSSAVSNTCSNSVYYKYSSSSGGTFNATSTALNPPAAKIAFPAIWPVADYAVIQYTNASNQLQYASSVLTVPIANESAGPRNSSGTYAGATSYTYNLTILSNGLLTLTYTSNANTTAGTTTVASNWPITGSNGVAPSSFTFGFAASTGGGTNIHEITCFQAAPAEDTNSSAAINAVEAGQIRTNTAVYLAYYHTHDWWGQLTSAALQVNATTGSVSVASPALWDASCDLTGDGSGTTLPGGSSCQATLLSSDSATIPGNRVMLSYDPGVGAGVPFRSAAGDLGAAQLNSLGGATGDDGLQAQRVLFLRGDRSNEITSAGAGLFRDRVSVLGDIVNSSPTWYGPPSEYYPTGAWVDLLYPTATMPESAATFGAFQSASAQASRLGIVYVGANDGFLHGFEAGTPAATATSTGSSNDGKEVIAFMPNAVVQTIHNATDPTQDFSSTLYGHNYYVDATPAIGDLFFNGAWHSWLVGGLGNGGSAIYALDVTTPANFTESNASKLVLGEWSQTSLTHLGKTYGTPQIVRLHTGNWAFIFGSGYNATGGTAGVYVGEITGATSTGMPILTFTFLSAPGTSNGIFSATPVDLDGDGITDYIYAGDMNGNLWRWDVTGNVSSGSPTGTQVAWPTSSPVKLFSTPTGQPITTQVEVIAGTNASGAPRLTVDFGTGEQLPFGTNPNSNTYASAGQALYGIWDGHMAAWNSMVSVAHQFDSFPATVTGSSGTQTIGQGYLVKASDLLTQTTTNIVTNPSSGTLPYRQISSTIPCWADGPNTCSNYGADGQYGWTYSLLTSSTSTTIGSSPEQVVANPIVEQGAFVVNTYIAQSQEACTTSNPTGWTIAINAATGAALPQSYFVNNITIGGVPLNESGVLTGATGSPSFVSTSSGTFLVTNTSSTGNAQVFQTMNTLNIGTRLNWTQLR